MYACTPYQITAMAALLKTGQKEPQTPNDARAATGNEIWYTAPMRPVRQTKQAARKYPTQTQSHDCHQDRPSTIIDDEIIQVF